MRALSCKTSRMIVVLYLVLVAGLVSVAHASPSGGYADAFQAGHITSWDILTHDLPYDVFPPDDHESVHDTLCVFACVALGGITLEAVRFVFRQRVAQRSRPSVQLPAGLSLPPGKRPPRTTSILYSLPSKDDF